MSGTWTISAKRLDLYGVGGHLYLEVTNSSGERYAQLHGYATDYVLQENGSYRREPHPIGDFGTKLEVWDYRNGSGIDPDNNDQAVVLYQGSEEMVLEALALTDQFEAYTRGRFIDYQMLPRDDAEVPSSSNPGETVTIQTYNSNSIFAALVDIMQVVLDIPQSAVNEAVEMGGGNPLTWFKGPNPGHERPLLDNLGWEPIVGGDAGDLEEYFTYMQQGLHIDEIPIYSLLSEGAVLADAGRLPDGRYFIKEVLPDGTFVTKTGLYNNGVLQELTRAEIYSSNSAIVTKNYVADANGNLGEPEVEVSFAGQTLQGEALGSAFGSILANYFADGNIFKEIVYDTALSTALGNISEGLQIWGNGTELHGKGLGPASIEESFAQAFSDLGMDVLKNAASAGIGTIASMLTVELLEEAGLDGLPGDVLASLTNNTIDTFLKQIVVQQQSLSGAVNALGDPMQIASGIGAFFGGYLASEIRTPETAEGQIGAAVGAAIFSLALGIGGFVGAFFGNMIGGLIGDAFGDEDFPRAAGVVSFDPLSQQFSLESVWTLDDGSYQSGEALGQAAVDSFNDILETIGGTITNPESIVTGAYGHEEGYLAYFDSPEDRWATKHFSEAKDLLSYGVMNGLRDVEIAGGDIYAKRAFYATLESMTSTQRAETVTEMHNINGVQTQVSREFTIDDTQNGLDALVGNLAVAAEYKEYLENHSVINSLIADNPESAFAAGWLITLLQASQLGLDQRHEADWLGGWNAFLENKGLDSTTIAFDIKNFSREMSGSTSQGQDILVPDSIVANSKDKFFASDTNARFIVNGKVIDSLHEISGYGETYALGNQIAVSPYVIGGSGADFISLGDKGGDAVGGAGDDVILGGKLDDWMLGGSGDDLLISGSSHGDYLNGQTGNDRIKGDSESDWLEGGEGNDTIIAGDGDDILAGGKGADYLDGGKGNDIYHYTAGDTVTYIKDSGDIADVDELRLTNAALTGLTYYTSSSDDDILVKVGAGENDWIVLEEGASDGFQAIERIRDTNGNVITLAGMLALATKSVDAGSSLVGSASSETLVGTIHDDILSGAGGSDLVKGGYGSDTYNYSTGAGADTIEENGFRQDIDQVVLSGLVSTSYTLGRGTTSKPELVLDFGSGNSITLNGIGNGPESTIEVVRFSDGVSKTTFDLSREYLAAASTVSGSITGFASNDSILSGDGNDTLTGGLGNDYLNGGSGNDTYVYALGDGHDRIYDNANGADILSLGGDITADDLVFHRTFDSVYNNDLGVSFAANAGSIFIRDQFNSGNSLEQVTFANGTTWNYSQLMGAILAQHSTSGNDVILGGHGAEAITGLAGNDVIYALAGNDTLTGGGGNDFLNGASGNDTYVYGTSDGHDRIYDNFSGTDTLSLGAGITATCLVFHRTFNYLSEENLGITFTGSTGSLLILEQFDSARTLEQFSFSGGTNWNYSQLMNAMLTQHSTSGSDIIMGGHGAEAITGLAGNDIIHALSGNDTLTGGTGNDFLNGDAGNDTYAYAVGDGHDRIYDDLNGTDKLSFGSGISTANLRFHRTFSSVGDENLLITFSNTNGSIFIQEQFDSTYTLEQLAFSGGTTWTYADVMTAMLTQHSTSGSDIIMGGHGAEAITGLAGNDIVYAQAGVDTLTGGTGNDFLNGGSGNDTYVYGIGDGHDRIYDNANGTDTLSFGAGIAAQNLIINMLPANIASGTTWVAPKDILITFSGFDGSIHISDQTSSSYAIENFAFAGGTLTYAQLLSTATVITYNSMIYANGNDTITGTNSDDAIYSGNGNDSIRGGTGNDYIETGNGSNIIYFGRGDGHDTIQTYFSTDTIVFEDGIASTEVDLTINPLNNALILHIGNDSLTIRGFGTNSYMVESFVFSNTTLSLAQLLQQRYLAEAATADYLYGTDASESISGGAGDDSIYSGNGNNSIRGGAGNDNIETGEDTNTIYFGRGDGHDTIQTYHSADTIVFEDGIVSTEVDLSINPLNNALILHVGNDSITIREFADNYRMVETFVFNDGMLTLAQLLTQRYLAEAATADYLYGTDASESIFGGAGDDAIYAGDGNDSIRGGAGSDYIETDGGVDTIYFGHGDGHDTVEVYNSTDTIIFDGIASTEVELSFNPLNNALILQIGNDSITIHGFGATTRMVENFVFSDGTLSLAQLLEKHYLAEAATSDYLYGTDAGESISGGVGDDAIYAGSGADTVCGGAGYDYLDAGAGNDVYYFNLGDGKDTLVDSSGTDVLRFGNGISAEDIEISHVPDNSNQLVLRIKGTEDSLTLDKSQKVETIEFIDGTVWSYDQFLKLAGDTSGNAIKPTATWGDDVLTGGLYSDTLEGSHGNDILQGGDGADSYLYNLGDGRDAIFDSSNDADIDRLIFGTGITPDMVSVSVWPTDANDVILTIGNTGDSIYLNNQKSGGGVEAIEFANGTIWNASTFSTWYGQINATAGYDFIVGSAANDDIEALQGNDVIYGGAGADTYRYSSGHGSDIIADLGLDNGTDKLIFSNIASTAVTVSFVAISESMVIHAGGAAITLEHQVEENSRGIEEIQFSNSVVWSRDKLEQVYLESLVTSGNNSIVGFVSSDTLSGGAGNDTLAGGKGSDTYLVNVGDAGTVIIDQGYATDIDAIHFGSGFTTSSLTVSRSGNDLLLDLGSGNTVTIKQALLQGATIIEQFVFSNGTLDMDDVMAKFFADKATAGANTIEGTNYHDVIHGLDGNDNINGGVSDDKLYGDGGNDIVNGSFGNDTIYGGLGNDTLTGESGLDVFVFAANAGSTDVITDFTSGQDKIDLTDVSLNAIQFSGLTISNSSGTAVIGLGNGQTIRLTGVDHTSLTASDFLFTPSANTAPVAVADSYELDSGTTLNVNSLAGVLANDTDAQNNTLSAILVSNVAHGTLTLNSNGSFSYTHNGTANYTDSFTYKVNDGTVDGNTVTVSFTIEPTVPPRIGTSGNDTLTGTMNAEVLEGLAGNDTLNAGSGNDTLIGGFGADVLKGEAGADIYRIADKSHSTAASTDMILGFNQTQGDKIDLSGLGFSDINNGQLNAEGSTLAYWHQFGDTFVGNADGSFRLRIDGELTLTRSDFIGVGPNYAFTHVGATGNDTLIGGAGNDAFNGGKGQDVLRGNGGSDIYFFDHLEDSRKASPDTILYWDSNDVIDVSYLGFTGIQANTANGSTLGWKVVGSNTEIFDSGKFLIRISNSTAVGGAPTLTASDFIFSDGPGFSDVNYTGTSNADDYSGGLGNDVLYGNAGDDVLTGGGGHDTIDGGDGNDTLYGGDGDDTLFGQSGYDRLEAGAGHDRLIAGTNKDWLVGGAGNDTFSFFSDSHSSETQPDTVADFVQGEDVIDLSTLTYTSIQSGAASGTVLGFTHQQNSSSQNITVIEADTGAFEIIVMGHINLVAGDFLF